MSEQHSISPRVRIGTKRDVNHLAELHRSVLSDESITQFGRAFMRCYYQAFLTSSYAVVLTAVDEKSGTVLGGLMGTLDPTAHYRLLIRKYGFALTAIVLATSLLHPSVGGMLIRTRLRRYVVGVVRQSFERNFSRAPVFRGAQPTPESVPDLSARVRVADLCHLFVQPSAQSQGIGSMLVFAYEVEARKFGVDRVDLVTFPSECRGVGAFYEKLGWTLRERRVSRSREEFMLYQKIIGDSPMD